MSATASEKGPWRKGARALGRARGQREGIGSGQGTRHGMGKGRAAALWGQGQDRSSCPGKGMAREGQGSQEGKDRATGPLCLLSVIHRPALPPACIPSLPSLPSSSPSSSPSSCPYPFSAAFDEPPRTMEAAERYTKEVKVGQGTYAVVFRGRDTYVHAPLPQPQPRSRPLLTPPFPPRLLFSFSPSISLLRVTGETVAVKKIRLGRRSDGIHMAAIREIHLLRELSHPNVVKVRGTRGLSSAWAGWTVEPRRRGLLSHGDGAG